jgi:hypothetical protein
LKQERTIACLVVLISTMGLLPVLLPGSPSAPVPAGGEAKLFPGKPGEPSPPDLPAGAARVLKAFLDESLPAGGLDRGRSVWQAPGRGATSGSDMFPGGIDPRYLRYLIEVLYRVGPEKDAPARVMVADAHVSWLASVVKESHPSWVLGNALEAIGLHQAHHGGTSPYATRAGEIVGWLRARRVEVRLPDGTTYGHFPCGYPILKAKDAGWTNDLSMVGAGLVWAFEVTGDKSILADAVSFAEYFVRPWRPNAIGESGYWECGTWREEAGCWVIGPAHFTGFESTDLYSDESSWIFSNLTCADFLIRLYRHQPDPRYLDRCVRAARWTFREGQFPDGAVGMCGRDDKWLGFTGAAVSIIAMINPYIQAVDERAPLLRDAKRAKAYLEAGLEKADAKTHGVEWVTHLSSTDPLVNVGMIWTYAFLGWLDGGKLRPAAGFADHGVAAPVAQAVWSGGVPAIDGAGRRIILFKLWGQTPPAAYVMVDAETGKTTTIDPGFNNTGSYATFLSPANRFYDTLADRFIEFDPASRKVIPVGKIPPDFALTLTIGDNGVIYAGMYPNGELVGFDPGTRTLTDFGPLAKEDWPQYLYLATDDKGWVYACINFKRGNIIAFNPLSGEKRQIYPEDKRGFRYGAEIWRGRNGRVYGRLGKEGWWRLHDGAGEMIDGEPEVERAVFTSTVTPPGRWADGSAFADLSVPGRRVSVIDAGAAGPRQVLFDYPCAGRPIYSMIAGPDKKIYGATGIPLRVFCFDPATGRIENRGLADYGGHVNQWVRQGNALYGAVYSGGELLEYDPSKPFEDAPIGRGANPRLAFKKDEARDLYGRPHAVLAHPDGRHVLVGGNPARGLAGGGLLIYDTGTGEGTILTRDDLIKDQGITALAALPNGDVVVGTTTEAATGGAATAREAVVYRLDWKSKKIAARWIPVAGLKSIGDLITGPDGLVYGLAAPDHFFVIDPADGRVVHSEQVARYGKVTGGMAPRTMALGPDQKIYALFSEAIVRIAPGTFSHQEVARPGIPIKAGIVIEGGRLYFSSDANLWSYDLSSSAER